MSFSEWIIYVHVEKYGITIYTSYISVDLDDHEIFSAKVGKGCINSYILNKKS